MTLCAAILVAALPLAVTASSPVADAPIPAIEGVVAAGTHLVLVKDGFDGTEGPVRLADGSLLFTENRGSVWKLPTLAPGPERAK